MTRQILFIEDNADDQLIVKLLAKRTNSIQLNVTCTSTVEDALAILRRERFDLILMDHRLHPFKGVAETLPILRKHIAGAEMIIVSDYIEGIDRDALPPGVTNVIAKRELPGAFADGRIS